MSRPKIRDLAAAAGLSVATVNRVLAGGTNVRQQTKQLVQEAAARIGFYGLGAIQARVVSSQPKYRLGFLLLQPHRPFYKKAADVIRVAAAAVNAAAVEVQIAFVDDLAPQTTAAAALALADVCDAICLTTAVHPLVIQTIEAIQARGVPVFALISQLSATGQVHYVGLDNWKAGRTAGWAMGHFCKMPGKVGILMGNPRYRNQEMNESGFRSYFREYAPEFTLLEPLSTFESSAVAEEMTERLLHDHPDLAGLYIAGGGITGTLAALRNSDRAGKLAVICFDMMENTRAALIDGTITLVISHPLRRLADLVIDGMIRAAAAQDPAANYTNIVPFELCTRENI